MKPANNSDVRSDFDISFYDKHTYDEFWIGRDYEHLSEIIAIRSLIGDNHFQTILDYGGGYGRLASTLTGYGDEVILADPSSSQLNLGKKKYKDLKNLKTLHLKENGLIPLESNSVDLVVMVRVSHHLQDPTPNFKEIHRVLKPNGRAIIEVANSAHAANRIKYALHFKRVPSRPIEIGYLSNGLIENTPFLNHNIKTIKSQLSDSHLKVVNKLSVSNLRSQSLKKYVRLDHLVSIEKFLQGKLSKFNFGPSVFILVEKV